MPHIMIDLETLDTKPSAAIVSIGACGFEITNGDIGNTFYQKVALSSAIDGRTISADTLKWWMTQDRDVRASTFDGVTLFPQALRDLAAFVLQIEDEVGCACHVWGNGSTFDISILEDAYRQHGIPVPWKFYNVRDVRTIVHVAECLLSRDDVPFEGVPHNALDGAKHQAKYVSLMWSALTAASMLRPRPEGEV